MNGISRRPLILQVAALYLLVVTAACTSGEQAPTPFVSAIVYTPSPFVLPTLTETSIPEATATQEIKQFKICQIENFTDCEISTEDLLNGNYLSWLQTLSKPFDPSKVNTNMLFVLNKRSYGSVEVTEITLDPSTLPNFSDPSTIPFRRDVTTGIVWFNDQGTTTFDIIKPIEFFDKNDPKHNKWIIPLDSYYYSKKTEHASMTPQDKYVTWGIESWKKFMRTTPIVGGYRSPNTGVYDPLVLQTYNSHPDMQNRFERFVKESDVGALSGAGILLLTVDIRNTTGAY